MPEQLHEVWCLRGRLRPQHGTTDRGEDRLAPVAIPAYDDTGDATAVRPLAARLDPALADLWKGGPGQEPVSWLGGHGWDAEPSDQSEVSGRLGRPEQASSGAMAALRPRLVQATKRG